MAEVVRTDRTIEVFEGTRRVFLTTIGTSGAWGECTKEVAEHSLEEFLKVWNFDKVTEK